MCSVIFIHPAPTIGTDRHSDAVGRSSISPSVR